MYKSPRYVRWLQEAGEAVQRQFEGEPYAGRVAVAIRLYSPTRAAYDIDNKAKPLLDLIKGVVIVDDDQVDDLWLIRGDKVKAGGAWITVFPMHKNKCPDWPLA